MRILVGCASMDSLEKDIAKASQTLLEALFAFPDTQLVYGAYNGGLMGSAYKAAKKNGRAVIGASPESFGPVFEEIACEEAITTPTISRRTEVLIDKGDVLLFLPGGIGTVYEFFSAFEWKRTGEFNKPLYLFNPNGYYDLLLAQLQRMVELGAARQEPMAAFRVFETPEALVAALKEETIG